MSNLDDRSWIERSDPMGMARLTEGFTAQLHEALKIAQDADIPHLSSQPTSVLLTGLGGSAAGGDLIGGLMAVQGKVPFLVNREYSVPSFVTAETLVFAVSYSGNTEETLAAYDDAKAKGANIIAVTSGGQLAERARADGFPVVIVPGGQPPRTATGYMLVPVLYALEKQGLVPSQDYAAAFDTVKAVQDECGLDMPTSNNPAKRLAKTLSGKVAVLYGLGAWQYAIAQRWRAQINENAKELVTTHFFPELCHNEILGWQGSAEQGVTEWVTVLLEGGDETKRQLSRVDISCGLIGESTTFHRVKAKGDTTLARILSLSHIGDYVSIYLAALAGRDPGEIGRIDSLKNALAKLPD